jgi:outer membrane protein assembly factor BamB
LVSIAGCDGEVRAIELKTGKELASAGVNSNFAASPAYHKGSVVVGDLDGGYRCVRLKKGEVVWEKTEDDAKFSASAAVSAQGAVLITEDGKVICCEVETGAPKWTFDSKSSAGACPVIAGERVFIGSGDGVLCALAMKDGAKLWEFKAGGAIAGGPCMAQGKLFIGTSGGVIYGLGAEKK